MCASLLMRFLPTLVALKSLAAAAPPQLKLLNVSFENALHPFLPPNSSSAYDSTVCMNPMIVKVDEEWRLYYAGADNSSKHRIACRSPTASAQRGTSTSRVDQRAARTRTKQGCRHFGASASPPRPTGYISRRGKILSFLAMKRKHILPILASQVAVRS